MSPSPLGQAYVKVVAVPVEDPARARRFYGEVLALAPVENADQEVTFGLGDAMLMLKPVKDWYGRPTAEPNPRITLRVGDASAVEQALVESGVTISDPVAACDGFRIGGFLDSEGNKFWFCSEP
jgi:catechol 2,3-dioxygenase-like lactoylglutathione lyase family enzyme